MTDPRCPHAITLRDEDLDAVERAEIDHLRRRLAAAEAVCEAVAGLWPGDAGIWHSKRMAPTLAALSAWFRLAP